MYTKIMQKAVDKGRKNQYCINWKLSNERERRMRMDRPGHRFSLRRQIVWSTRVFTVLTSLAVCAALFFLSNQYVRTNTLQAAEFNLRLVATSIETSLNDADALLNWASINDTVRRYLSQEEVNGPQTTVSRRADLVEDDPETLFFPT